LKMGSIRCPETSVNNYHATLSNILEERRSEFLSWLTARRPTTYTCKRKLSPKLPHSGAGGSYKLFEMNPRDALWISASQALHLRES
jgi:hypothetical protein